MHNSFDSVLDMITKIVRDATKFYVPRIGIVSQIVDSLGKGRILVQVPSLGWFTDNESAWCYPKDKKAVVTPDVGDYVIVEFIDGDMNLPVYSGMALQMKNMLPENQEGNNNNQVLFENRSKDEYIRYNEITKLLEIVATEINLNGNTKTFVTHAELDSAIQTFITALNLHIHSGVTTGGGVSGPPSAGMSLDISAAETTTVKTGG